MQVVVGGDFDIQPDGRVKLRAAPLLKLGGDGGEIAFQHRQRLGDRHLQRFNCAEFTVSKTHQVHAFGFAGLIKTERNGRATVANVLAAADDLCPVNVSEGDIVGWREVLCRESIQRANINVTYRVTFTGSNSREMPGGNHRNRPIAAQGTGIGMLLVIIVGNSL